MNTKAAETPVSEPAAVTLAGIPRFIDHGDGTVTDMRQGLMFSKATLTPSCVTHAEAEKVCADLALAGHTDWRLPTIEELFLLADRSRINPAIDTAYFPDTHNDWYWSSTIRASSSDCAWVVAFGFGAAYSASRVSYYGLFRAVRAVAPGQ